MRGYYRIPKRRPANRVDTALAEIVCEKFGQGWPKARIAREFRLNRRTVARICEDAQVSKPHPPDCAELPQPNLSGFVRVKRRFRRHWWIPPAQDA